MLILVGVEREGCEAVAVTPVELVLELHLRMCVYVCLWLVWLV